MTFDFHRLKRELGVDTIFLKTPHTNIDSNVYAIPAKRSIVLIDTGSRVEDNARKLFEYLDAADQPVYVLITHEHTDHMGMANLIRKRYRARIHIHAHAKKWAERFEREWDARSERIHETLARSGFPGAYRDYLRGFDENRSYAESFRPDVYIRRDGILELDGRRVKVIHTPGHSVGSVCYYDLESELLFTGDHVIGGFPTLPTMEFTGNGLYPSVRRGIRSFERLRDHADACCILPGHGGIVDDLERQEKSHIGFVDRYRRNLASVLRDCPEPLAPFELYTHLYGSGDMKSPTHFFGRVQLLFCMLDLLEGESVIRRTAGPATIRYRFHQGA